MTTQNLEMLIGLFVPILVSFLKRETLPNGANAVIAVAVYAVVGLAAVFVSGQVFDLNNIVPAVTIFVTEGTVAYQLFWKNWGDPQITAYVSGKPKT